MMRSTPEKSSAITITIPDDEKETTATATSEKLPSPSVSDEVCSAAIAQAEVFLSAQKRVVNKGKIFPSSCVNTYICIYM